MNWLSEVRGKLSLLLLAVACLAKRTVQRTRTSCLSDHHSIPTNRRHYPLYLHWLICTRRYTTTGAVYLVPEYRCVCMACTWRYQVPVLDRFFPVPYDAYVILVKKISRKGNFTFFIKCVTQSKHDILVKRQMTECLLKEARSNTRQCLREEAMSYRRSNV